ncbi:MAG: hypothetical protein GX796_08855 [Clostridiaceae bacterium]|nr:hypothetical protein [Clostridiaceae bacterium]
MDRFEDSKMREALKQVKENSKYIIEYIAYAAKMNRTYYEELLRQSFTEQQALDLVKMHGLPLFPGK